MCSNWKASEMRKAVAINMVLVVDQKAPTTDQRLFNEAALRSDARIMALPPEFNCKSNYKSVRYEWLKAASPYFYRRLRKDWACCKVPSVGVCAIDHECRFPVL